jgi:1-carboxybiuret hydrolase subunit AtzG-like protein
MTRKTLSRKTKTARRVRPPARPLRSRRPDHIGMLAAAGVKALALPIEPAWQAGITFNLQLLFKHAALIDGFALPDDSEPGPVFRA